MLHSGTTNMANDTDARIKTLLDKYERSQEADKERAKRLSGERQEFERNFQAAVQNVIRPAAQPIIDSLKARGHRVEVKPDMEGVITISILPSGSGARAPSLLSFRPHPSERSVLISGKDIVRRGGSTSGPRGEYPLTQLTKEAVEKELMLVVSEIFEV
jgi:hypothetical protein